MKNRHLLAILLAFVLTVSALLPMTTVNANAAVIVQSSNAVTVNVDGNTISDINAYLDKDNNVRVTTGDDLLKIFPNELKDTIIAYDPSEGILLKDYITDFKYSYRLMRDYSGSNQSGYTLYIYSNNGGTTYPPSTSFEYPEIYINGVYFPITNIYQYWSIDFSKYKQPIFSGNRVYFNNDGNSPVEVFVDGNLVHFPDQQPIIVDPGRTMVPIRMIAEMLGCKVDWNNAQRCAIITCDQDIMYIYPGSTSYLFNGKYYDMDVTPVVVNSRTLVPLRFIAERFGYKVEFQNGDVISVFLTSQ